MQDWERDIHEKLGKILATQDLILKGFQEHDEKDMKIFESFHKRITAIEKKINYAAGAVATFTLFFTIALDYVKQRIFGA